MASRHHQKDIIHRNPPVGVGRREGVLVIRAFEVYFARKRFLRQQLIKRATDAMYLTWIPKILTDGTAVLLCISV